MEKLSDEDVISNLKSSDEVKVEEAFNYLYHKSQHTARRHILKNRGNEQDVDDVFHDALLAFYKLARQNKLKPDVNVQAYLFTICRNMWSKKLKEKYPEVELKSMHFPKEVEEIRFSLDQKEYKSMILDEILGKMDKDCLTLIRYFYYDKLRMKEIVKKMNISSEQVAKNKKMNCIKKLQKLMLKSPLYPNLKD